MIRSALLAIPDGGQYPTDPVEGNPSAITRYVYGGEENPLLGVQWANGDAGAWTDIAFGTDGSQSVVANAPAGNTSIETGLSYNDYSAQTLWARHTRGGTPGDWVQGI